MPSVEASSRSFFAVDSRLLVRTAPGETLDTVLPDQRMATCGVVLPHECIAFGLDAGWRGSEASGLHLPCRRRVLAAWSSASRQWKRLDGLAKGGGRCPASWRR
jgi:hypothetical protein